MHAAMQLTLKPAQLRLIVEVAESGQLQIAAAATSMTQPAASRMLAEIERAVGAPLFLRQPKGMELTEIGAVINGASELFLEIFGERGAHARVAVGAYSMPLGVAVEIEAVMEVE